MKNTLCIISISLLAFACTRQPVAKFRTNANAPIAGEEVRITNTSEHAVSYEWDFGDGQTSTVKHPDHVFELPGTYLIRLIAYSEGKKKMDDFELSLFVKWTTAQYVAHKWSLDSLVTYSYTDGELTNLNSIDYSEFYTTHTAEFDENGTFETNLDGSINGGEWSVLAEQYSLHIDGSICYLEQLSLTDFVFYRVLYFGGSTSELIDTSYTYMSI